jgi:hypothetical protein
MGKRKVWVAVILVHDDPRVPFNASGPTEEAAGNNLRANIEKYIKDECPDEGSVEEFLEHYQADMVIFELDGNEPGYCT